jgi:hypothetical protein
MCSKSNLYSGFFNFRTTLLPVIVILLLASCKKSLTIPPPTDFVISDVVFKDDGTAIGAVTGIYSDMMNNKNNAQQFTSAGVTIYAGMCSDELSHLQPTQGSRNEFINNQLSSNNSNISVLFWDKAYKYIYTANSCLEGLEKSTTLSSEVKNVLRGECHFIRAFCYFYLVNLFGDVPLVVTSDYRENMHMGRTPVKDIYDRMIDDLIKAKILLPEQYDVTGGIPPRTRPNKWTVTALLARVYLYKKDWINAELESDEIIRSGMYTLATNNLGSVFSANTTSAESIWQLLPVVATNNTWEGNLLLPANATAQPGYILTNSLVSAFEPNDKRFTSWAGPRSTYFFPNKYKVRTTNPSIKEYYVVFRLAEQYLIRAEARANRNRLEDARNDINTIRVRAGLDSTQPQTQDELLLAIERERRVELFAEWGHRWFDLKRTNRADAVLDPYKPTWDATDVLWPIPAEQIRLNDALTQNQGY